MNRSRRWYVLALLAFLSPGLTLIARGQNPPKDNQTSAEKWLLDRNTRGVEQAADRAITALSSARLPPQATQFLAAARTGRATQDCGVELHVRRRRPDRDAPARHAGAAELC